MRLISSVYVVNPATFETVLINAGDEVPSWAKPLIKNPDLISKSHPDAVVVADDDDLDPEAPGRLDFETLEDVAEEKPPVKKRATRRKAAPKA